METNTQIFSETIDPRTLDIVAQEKVWPLVQSGQLMIPAGPIAALIATIERYTQKGNRHADQVLISMLRIYRWMARFCIESKWIKGLFDLFVIEDEGAMTSLPIKHILRRNIDAQANVLINRHFLRANEQSYRYEVIRPSIGPRFGDGNKPVLFIDPSLATGGSILSALDWLKEQGVVISLDRVHIWTIVAAPLGIDILCSQGAHVVTAKLAHGVNEQGYIINENKHEYIGDVSSLLAESYER